MKLIDKSEMKVGKYYATYDIRAVTITEEAKPRRIFKNVMIGKYYCQYCQHSYYGYLKGLNTCYSENSLWKARETAKFSVVEDDEDNKTVVTLELTDEEVIKHIVLETV